MINLDHYGIRGVSNKLLLASYLKNRKQFVLIDGIKSTILNVKIGITHFSIFDTLLYVIYVNYIPNALNCIPQLNRMMHVWLYMSTT